eukprot:7079931-Pyramimonas_sp.AAC.1
MWASRARCQTKTDTVPAGRKEVGEEKLATADTWAEKDGQESRLARRGPRGARTGCLKQALGQDGL